VSRGFRFRLEAALQHRVRLEQTAQLVLSRTVQGRNAAAAELARLQQELAGARRRPAPVGVGFDCDIRMSQLYYMDRLAQRIQQQQVVLGKRDAEVRSARDLLVQASARRKALERLRERRQLEFDDLAQQLEAKQLDELTMPRYARSAELGGQAYAPLYD